jgi:hypothetical protein
MSTQQLTGESLLSPPEFDRSLCARCKVNHKSSGRGKKYCDKCSIESTTTCSKCKVNPTASKYTPWCLTCSRTQQHEYRKRCIESGLCTDCGKCRSRPNRRTCQSCEDKRKPYRRTLRQELKGFAVQYLGGACKDCGFTTEHLDVFDFHHRDPADKSFTIGLFLKRDWNTVRDELDKCDLLCANCHRIRHAKMGGTHHRRK